MRKPKGKLRVAYGEAGDTLWNVYVVRVDEDGDWRGDAVLLQVFEHENAAAISARDYASKLDAEFYKEPERP